jgi:sRNA-binding protein
MTKQMSEGQRRYEARRAEKAGVSLEKWLQIKERERAEAVRARERAAAPPPPPRKPGFFARLIERAHKPL